MIDRIHISKMFTFTPSVKQWVVRKLAWLSIVALLFFNFASKFLDLFQLSLGLMLGLKNIQVQEREHRQQERYENYGKNPT
jgi:hypothetical protein